MSKPLFKLVFILFLCLQAHESFAVPDNTVFENSGICREDDKQEELRELTERLRLLLESYASIEECESTSQKIVEILNAYSFADSSLLAESYFLTGMVSYRNSRYDEALEQFSYALKIKSVIGEYDLRYSNFLNASGVVYFRRGQYYTALDRILKAINIAREYMISDSSFFANYYMNIASNYLEVNEMEKAIVSAESGLEIARIYPGKIDSKVLGALYHDIGIALSRKSEYTKSLVYYNQALRQYNLSGKGSEEQKAQLLSAIAYLYQQLGDKEKAEENHKKALSYINDISISETDNVLSGYAAFLAVNGRMDEAEEIQQRALKLIREIFGVEDRHYCLSLVSYASFISEKAGDGKKALDIYKQCLPYVKAHPEDYKVRNYVLVEYAGILMDQGEFSEAVEILNDLMQSVEISESGSGTLQGHKEKVLLSPRNLRRILSLKIKALNILYDQTQDKSYLYEAIDAGKKLISLYDRLRLDMSEEESRNFLSADARDSYAGMIKDYSLLMGNNDDRNLLQEAFMYAEKSKVSSFLTSMRELNATRFSLPEDLIEYDNELQLRIGAYRELISKENLKVEPDPKKTERWEAETFNLLRLKDSLINVFEHDYPSYYKLKYRTDAIEMDDVNDVIGKGSNLLSYILTDDRLYIFIVNRKHTKLISQPVDSAFFAMLGEFRESLSEMPDKTHARTAFSEYMELGYALYSVLLEPALPYLAGDRVVISPDNILSYLPFETLITEPYSSNELLYRDAPFALKKYRFSYIYSVTLSSETQKRSRSMINRLVAFAPSYDNVEIPDSLLNGYPGLRSRISPLPYALDEAEDAVSQCGGKAFLEMDATETSYKRVASDYEIVHLAMHTLLNDANPAYSKMLFAPDSTGTDDGLLNTYEVYTVPLNAMMVVLSSCNTGSGVMITGEGILSLARGFLFAGSRSVVMSMWEVEDRTGASIVRSFYRNIRKGMSKSDALREARMDFLDNADQARSHPYHWAALVVYGDDKPLYYNRLLLLEGLGALFLTGLLIIILFYRDPRS